MNKILMIFVLCLLLPLTGRAEGYYWTGDISGNGDAENPRVTVLDQVLMVRILSGRAAAVPAADINGDKVVDMTDLNLLVDIILGRREPVRRTASISIDGEGTIIDGGNVSDQDVTPRQDVKPLTTPEP